MATVAIGRAGLDLVVMTEHSIVDLDTIEWDSLRKRSYSLEDSACQGLSNVLNGIAVDTRNSRQIEEDPKVKRRRF